MIGFKSKGDFKNTETFIKKWCNTKNVIPILEKYGQMGVNLLKDATPVDTSKTSESWYYEIEDKGKEIAVSFLNSNVVDGVNIAIILQYGHGTRNGGYVKGIDYINPAIQEAFNGMKDELIKEVGRK